MMRGTEEEWEGKKERKIQMFIYFCFVDESTFNSSTNQALFNFCNRDGRGHLRSNIRNTAEFHDPQRSLKQNYFYHTKITDIFHSFI